MNESNLVSVVMPAYNAERFIEKAISTILNQTYNNIELLVIDDCSKDGTAKIIQSFTDPRLKLYYNEKNLGYLKTCNKLFALAKGEFIAFQDADDYSDLKRIELQMNEFLKYPSLAVCGTNLTAMNESGKLLFCSNYFCDKQNIISQTLEGQYSITPNSFVFKREILDNIGGYNEFWDGLSGEDIYWAWRIMERYSITNIKPALYYYRHNPNSMTGNWSDNIRKLHTATILNHLLRQRKERGTDDLEQMNFTSLNEFVDNLEKPYKDDISFFYREVARRDFYRGNKKRALSLMLKTIRHSPLKIINYKILFYYLRTKKYQE